MLTYPTSEFYIPLLFKTDDVFSDSEVADGIYYDYSTSYQSRYYDYDNTYLDSIGLSQMPAGWDLRLTLYTSYTSADLSDLSSRLGGATVTGSGSGSSSYITILLSSEQTGGLSVGLAYGNPLALTFSGAGYAEDSPTEYYLTAVLAVPAGTLPLPLSLYSVPEGTAYETPSAQLTVRPYNPPHNPAGYTGSDPYISYHGGPWGTPGPAGDTYYAQYPGAPGYSGTLPGALGYYTSHTFSATGETRKSQYYINQSRTYYSVVNTPSGTDPIGSPGGSGAAVVPVAYLTLDAHRRPLAATGSGSAASGTISGLWSNDAGHSFSSASIVTSGADPSLLVDTRTNRFSLIYYRPADPSGTPPAALMRAFGQIADGYPQDAGSPAAISTLSGQYPIAVKHPTDRDYTLLAYLDSGALKTAFSLDFGATWNALGTVDTGLDFTATGRAGLCFLGELAIVVYGSGNNLLCQASPDRGDTWGAAVTIGSSGPYSGLSLLGWQGRLYLLAWTVSGSTATPALLGSSDLGATWAAIGGILPALTPPTGLGVIPQSGQLRLGTTNNSADDGATWPAD